MSDQEVKSVEAAVDLGAACRAIADRARAAARVLASARGDQKDAWLAAAAARVPTRTSVVAKVAGLSA